ncbi:MAG TPA: sugar nucleotide-binding protein [Pyrinomonadaceae bacterium]|jgi:dTDP-4-dehydrorhamnose reductase|nr:sugar nucleotide-binding protein [Pyrinomonadaceae bacterium]
MTAEELSTNDPDLWLGVECTVNRVGDSYSDQLERSGHALRIADLERMAELGVRTVRYPVLWERTAPQALDQLDWTWADERLADLRRLELKPIVGLVHHGSGPRYTSLLDPQFPELLADYAGKVARRYPWVTDYTPVNEPLTTARFSCLYGLWYPHSRDPLQFAKALLNQCRAVILSMHSIRQVNPAARLIQTEDLGKTFSTPTLAYQADFENERRWLTFDLLCGQLTSGTAMWEYLSWLGIEPAELEWFLENRCPPDLLGINHYITSERFLDERLNRYPAAFHGGNGRHLYADVEAVRVCSEGVAGPKAILAEAWNRYALPLAITEAHLGCTREEQLRWLSEVWTASSDLRAAGVDVRAVTAWAAFGTFDWNNLLTTNSGCYEPGVFDLRALSPRPTALAGMIRALTAGKEFDHPVLDTPGWWRRLDRLCYPPVTHREHGVSSSVNAVRRSGTSSRSILITGATGTLGQAFARICGRRGLAYHLLSRKEMDIADRDSVLAAFDFYEPWAIINAAGYVRVDDAETDKETCWRENVIGPENLASECALNKVPLVTFSSDLVFDGFKGAPYVEGDSTSPINVYGESKAAAEVRVLDKFPEALVIRTSAFFGPWDKFNFVHAVVDTLSHGRPFIAADDAAVSPTYVPDLVNCALDLLIDDEHGIWHLANSGVVTWADFARLVATKAGFDVARVHSRSRHSFGLAARRPLLTALSSERGNLMPPLEESLERCIQENSWSQGNAVAAQGSSH